MSLLKENGSMISSSNTIDTAKEVCASMTSELKKIIQKSITRVLCIDDQYIEPYEDISNLKDDDIRYTKNMYNSLVKSCGNVSLMPYRGEVNSKEVSSALKKKDLLILDWDLDNNGNTKPALEIVSLVAKSNTPFICIYTHKTDVAEILNSINVYFSFSKEQVKKTMDNANSAHIFQDEYTKILNNYSEFESDVFEKLKEAFVENGVDSNIFDYDNIDECNKLWINWKNWLVVDDEVDKLNCSVVSNNCIRVCDKYVVICNKENKANGGQNENVVSIIDILSGISTALSNIESAPINGIWLFFTNLLRDNLNIAGDYFEELSWKAFAGYGKQLLDEYGEEEMNRFLREVFFKHIFQKVDANDNNSFPEKIVNAIKESGAKVKTESDVAKLKLEYKKLNTFLNVNTWKTKSEHDLTFGDVLQDTKTKDYYMCVSPLCECAVHANETGKQDFFFIQSLPKQSDETEETQMQKLESGFFSCIKDNMAQDGYSIIKWNDKLKFFHFNEIRVKVGPDTEQIVPTVNGIGMALKYVCTISQEYAQRMANQSFASGSRVGVSYATLSKS